MKMHWPQVLDSIDLFSEEDPLYIFGYGSLIWNPGFKFDHSIKAKANGYARRFYQGNITHRGNKEMPGRVATIVPDPRSSVFGLVFQVSGVTNMQAALEHLYWREIASGYSFEKIELHLVDDDSKITTISALTVITLKDNDLFLGPTDTLHSMAHQIANAKGKAGYNSEYLFKLAEAVREHFPGVFDYHLFELESLVKSILIDQLEFLY